MHYATVLWIQNTLNLDPDLEPGFWPNLDPDPGYRFFLPIIQYFIELIAHVYIQFLQRY